MMKSRRMRWVGHVAHMRETRNVYEILVGKCEGKRPLGKPRHRWTDWRVWIGFIWLRIRTGGNLL
jgi:hypothetical protein